MAPGATSTATATRRPPTAISAASSRAWTRRIRLTGARVWPPAPRSPMSMSMRPLLARPTWRAITLGGYLGGMAGAFALRGGGMWAWSDIDTSRAVVFPGFFERQKASYDADTGQTLRRGRVSDADVGHGDRAVRRAGLRLRRHGDFPGAWRASRLVARSRHGSRLGYSTLGFTCGARRCIGERCRSCRMSRPRGSTPSTT